MATFYGQVKGNGKTNAMRQGSEASGITASVQSWKGSLTVEMTHDEDGGLRVQVYAGQGSKMYGTTIWRGGIDGFCKALCGHTFDEMEG